MLIRNPSTVARFTFTLLVVMLATLLRFALEPILDLQVPFILYFPTIVLCAWFGGLRQGILSTALGGLIAWYAFIPPLYSFKASDSTAQAQLVIFSLAGTLISLLAESLHLARRKTEASEAREREQREQFRVTLASIGDAVIATDAQGRVTFMNPVAESLTGWKQEALGRPLEEVFNIVNEQTRQQVENPAVRAMKEGVIVGLANHTVLMAKDGAERPIDDSGAPIKDSEGKTLGAVLIFRDITERRRAERERALLADIVESSEDAIISKSFDGLIESWNAAAVRLFGYAASEAIGKPISIIVPPAKIEEERLILERLRKGERIEDFETVRLSKNGRAVVISLSISPIRDATGRIVGCSKIVRDITERKRYQQELFESRERLRMAMEAGQMGTWTRELDETNRTRWSPELEHIFGLEPGEFPEAEEAFFDFVHPDDREAVRQAVGQAIENRVDYEVEFRYQRKGGGQRWMMGRGRAFYDDAGRPFRLAGLGWDITERKQAEVALRESEQRFRLVADAAPVLIWMSGTDKLCTWFNRPWLDFVGRSLEQELGNGWAENVHPDDFDRCLQTYTAAFDARQALSMEYRLRRHDGEYRWVLDSGVPRYGSDSEFTGYIGSCVDITDRRQAEGALRQQREWLRVTLSSIGDAVIATDTSGVVTFLNPVAESLTGWKQEEAEGQPLEKVFHIVNEQTRKTVENPALRAIRESVIVGLANHTVLISKDGAELPIDDSGAPIKDNDGKIFGAVLIFRDITERRLAEDRFRVAVESAPNSMIMIDEEGRIILVNSQTERLFGYAREELIGQPIEMLVPERFRNQHPEYRSGFARMPQARPMGAGRDLFGLRKDGSEVSVEIGLNPIQVNGKTLILSSIVDITERKRAEKERSHLLASERAAREQAEAASRAKDEFVAMISHEIRSPLNAILGWAQMLRLNRFDEAQTARAIETIERNARAQVQIIEDLLDISRVITGKLNLNVRPVEPAQVIEAAIDSIRPAADAKAIQLRVHLEPRGSLVSGDPNRLRQIVWNLLSNAVKFTPRQGHIEVRAQRITSHFQITVSDSGVGIKPEFLPFVFDRYSQASTGSERKQGGLGLGLAIVRHLVELHGGTVRADSPGEEQGATFTVRLPVRVVREEISEFESTYTSAEYGVPLIDAVTLDGLRVMIVDDEAETRNLLVAMLAGRGAEVKACASAAEALEAVEQWRPLVLVSDIGMPDEDGYVLMRKLRALGPERGGNTPAVALTAYARTEDRLRALAVGFQMHVPKPVEAGELIMVIANLAGRAGKAIGG